MARGFRLSTCVPRVYVDGMRMVVDGYFPLDGVVVPEWIEGMEVYTSELRAPQQYAAGTGCGVILIWTR